jgi:hypothetical protein
MQWTGYYANRNGSSPTYQRVFVKWIDVLAVIGIYQLLSALHVITWGARIYAFGRTAFKIIVGAEAQIMGND